MSRIIRIKNLNIGQGRPKICALVIGEKSEDILKLAEMSNTVDCDMIELRIDHFESALEPDKVKSLLRKVRRSAKKPMIFTFRRKEEGGKISTTLKYYKELLTMVADNGLADLIDVEASAIEHDSRFVDSLKERDTYVIISKHDFQRTPDEEELFRTMLSMEQMGADIVKVAYMPNSKKDVLNLINVTTNFAGKYASCPVIAISMGHLGMITRIMGEFLESAITFAAITRSSAPGQINIEGMEQILDIIHNNYRKVFLVGFMGSGKTAVANELANSYGLNKLDLDAYIEQKEQMSIADLFGSSEELFRDKETKYLRQVLRTNYQVLSLGSGIVFRRENIALMKEKGVIIFLRACAETISERIRNDRTRVLLGENFDLDYIKGLMKEREKFYLAEADVVIDTDDKSVEEICKEIVATLGFTL